jgi:hypothetical protein
VRSVPGESREFQQALQSVRIPIPKNDEDFRKDGGRFPISLGDKMDGTVSSNQVGIIQISNASYLRELNKYNTSF